MDRGSAVARFTYEVLSLHSYCRAIVLFGVNTQSYKFALADALLEVGSDAELISLEDLALPYASRIAEHMRTHDKQATSPGSSFVKACRAFNYGELDADGLRGVTVKEGGISPTNAIERVDELLDERLRPSRRLQ